MTTSKEFVSGRRAAYKRVFDINNPDVQFVLKDLARFGRAHESTFAADPHISSKMDGRREVWLRIQQHLNLTDEQLWGLFGA